MFVVGGGGFVNETKPILREISKVFEVSILLSNDITEGTLDTKGINSVFLVHPVTLRSLNKFQMAGSFCKAIYDSYLAINKFKPEVIICLGTSIAIPVFLVGKIIGTKNIFIETITRVEEISLTARILMKLRLSDRLYVQWPDLENKSRGVLYKGGIV